MKQENQLILEICKFQDPDAEKIKAGLAACGNTSSLLGKILLHRMGGVAYDVLRKCELLGAVNREFRTTLHSMYTANCLKNQSFKRGLEYLSNCLNGVTVPYAALKGAYLAERYPAGYRTSNDIDLLLAPEDVSEIGDRLTHAGFKQGYIRNGVFKEASRAEIIHSRMNRGETVPYILKTDYPFLEYLEVDLNFSLDYKPGDSKIVTEMLRAYATTASGLHTLRKIDFLIHLCAHLYKEATTYAWIEMGRDLSLYKFADIYFMLKDFGKQDYTDLEQRIHALGMEKECIYALVGTELLFAMRDDMLEILLTQLAKTCTGVLDKVIDPVNGKEYVYTIDFCTRFFENNRKAYLKEVPCYGKTAYV